MRSPFFSFLAGTLASLSLSAHAHALPEGGTLITPPDAIASMRETASSAHGMLTRVKAEGSPFTSVIRCQTAANVPHPWSFQFQFRTTRRVEKGEVLLLTFHARTVTSKNESGEGKGRGVSTTSYSIGDASEYAKCEHLPLPFMAEFKMEMVTNGSEVTFKPVKGGFKPLGVVETAFEQVAGDKVAGPTPVKADKKAA